MNNLPKPNKKSVIFEDENVYVCLAKNFITEGHCVVVSKKYFFDLNQMPDIYYDYLMDVVFAVRNALIKTLKVKKVYLVYMDEAEEVHWHLIPRYKEKGFDVFNHKAGILKDFSLAEKIKKNLIFK
jgi:diadenosine tetraphosphate (Ap4A) HIT family hydrolase